MYIILWILIIHKLNFIMNSTPLPLTKDDFVNSDWQEIVNSSEKKECLSYWRGFWDKVKEASSANDDTNKRIYELLALVTHAAIKREPANNCFPSSIDRISEDQLTFLPVIVTEISDPELQARVTDILWVRQNNYQMALLAIDAYLQSATILESPEHWPPCVDRIGRAFYLSQKLNHKQQKVIDHIESVLDKYNGEDPLWLSTRLMEMLQSARIGSPTKYASLSEKAALSAEADHRWDKARRLWHIRAVWHRMDGDRQSEFSASMRECETFVAQAEHILQQKTPLYSLASVHLEKAVAGFRSIRGTEAETAPARERAKEVHKMLLTYQENIPGELIPISEEIDISVFVEKARDAVRGKTLQDAFFALTAGNIPVNMVRLESEVRRQASEFILSNMFPIRIYNGMGKVVATQPGSIDSSDLEESKKAVLFKMYQDAILHHDIAVKSFIEPAREQIVLEHNVSIQDILFLITPSAFIPPGREYSFAKGIHAGLEGDFLVSAQILIPQIENSIRYIMWQRKIITSGLDDRGIQNEHSLNSILDREEVITIFNENTLFDLRGILIEHSGSNLRNRMAHGLIDDHEFYSSTVVRYLWWLSLRLCYLPVLKPFTERNEEVAEKES